MSDTVKSIPALTLTPVETANVQPRPAESSAGQTDVSDQPRLAIERGPAGFVYKVLDRTTGEVIRQIPHESLADLAKAPDYDGGAVIKTSV